jgi:hypothetical protein
MFVRETSSIGDLNKMWVFIPEGFFSIVQDKKNPKILIVRSRYVGDLERLVNAYFPKQRQVLVESIREWAGTDYRYRLLMNREEVESVFGKAAASITYTNFKNEVTKQHGHARHDLYMKVWYIMSGAQSVKKNQEDMWARYALDKDVEEL